MLALFLAHAFVLLAIGNNAECIPKLRNDPTIEYKQLGKRFLKIWKSTANTAVENQKVNDNPDKKGRKICSHIADGLIKIFLSNRWTD